MVTALACYMHYTYRALRTSVTAVLTESRAAQAAETSSTITSTSAVPPAKPPYILNSTTNTSTGMHAQNSGPHVHPHFFHGLSSEVQAMLLEVHRANGALFLSSSNSNSDSAAAGTKSVSGDSGAANNNSVSALSRASNTGGSSKASSHHSKVSCMYGYLHA
jgi:hypothetical protein